MGTHRVYATCIMPKPYKISLKFRGFIERELGYAMEQNDVIPGTVTGIEVHECKPLEMGCVRPEGHEHWVIFGDAHI